MSCNYFPTKFFDSREHLEGLICLINKHFENPNDVLAELLFANIKGDCAPSSVPDLPQRILDTLLLSFDLTDENNLHIADFVKGFKTLDSFAICNYSSKVSSVLHFLFGPNGLIHNKAVNLTLSEYGIKPENRDLVTAIVQLEAALALAYLRTGKPLDLSVYSPEFYGKVFANWSSDKILRYFVDVLMLVVYEDKAITALSYLSRFINSMKIMLNYPIIAELVTGVAPGELIETINEIAIDTDSSNVKAVAKLFERPVSSDAKDFFMQLKSTLMVG